MENAYQTEFEALQVTVLLRMLEVKMEGHEDRRYLLNQDETPLHLCQHPFLAATSTHIFLYP